jgi:hypothetical protein
LLVNTPKEIAGCRQTAREREAKEVRTRDLLERNSPLDWGKGATPNAKIRLLPPRGEGIRQEDLREG